MKLSTLGLRQISLRAAASVAVHLVSVAAFAAGLSLYELSPRAETVGGVQLPRNGYDLYRGLNEDQINYAAAVKAMLGDQSENVESPMFTVLKMQLMGKSSPLLTTMAGLQEEYNYFSFGQAIAKIKKPLDEDSAIQKADRLMSDAITASYAQERVFDYGSAYRNDWPRSFVFSTSYVEVAKIYGPHILVFNESRERRSLDMNFWNKVNRGYWVHTNLSFPDKGEFVTPFYIPARQITGYQWNRSGFRKTDWNVWKPLSADLPAAYMKLETGGASVVLLLDTEGLQHVVRSGDTVCGAVSAFDPAAVVPKITQADCRIKPRIAGIIRLCDKDAEPYSPGCTVDDSLFAPYASTKKSFRTPIQHLETLTVNGKKLVVLLPPDQRPKKEVQAPAPVAPSEPATSSGELKTPETVTEDKQPSASAASNTSDSNGLNVPASAGGAPNAAKSSQVMAPSKRSGEIQLELINEKGGPGRSHRYPLPCSQSTNKVICDFPGVNALDPKEEFYIEVPSDLQSVPLQHATIIHYQTEGASQSSGAIDKTPGYSSIQCHSPSLSDPWRYSSSRKNKKGAVFAMRLGIDETDAKGQFVPFDKNAHPGVKTDDTIEGPLTCDAIRIQNTGSDRVTYKKLVLTFQ